jgi:hypothetical protein
MNIEGYKLEHEIMGELIMKKLLFLVMLFPVLAYGADAKVKTSCDVVINKGGLLIQKKVISEDDRCDAKYFDNESNLDSPYYLVSIHKTHDGKRELYVERMISPGAFDSASTSTIIPVETKSAEIHLHDVSNHLQGVLYDIEVSCKFEEIK